MWLIAGLSQVLHFQATTHTHSAAHADLRQPACMLCCESTVGIEASTVATRPWCDTISSPPATPAWSTGRHPRAHGHFKVCATCTGGDYGGSDGTKRRAAVEQQ